MCEEGPITRLTSRGMVVFCGAGDRADRVRDIAALIDNFIFQEGIRGQRIIVMRRSLFS